MVILNPFSLFRRILKNKKSLYFNYDRYIMYIRGIYIKMKYKCNIYGYGITRKSFNIQGIVWLLLNVLR